ncbi:MAG: Kelch repeat-containing protein [Acidimicrobiia bacterium]
MTQTDPHQEAEDYHTSPRPRRRPAPGGLRARVLVLVAVMLTAGGCKGSQDVAAPPAGGAGTGDDARVDDALEALSPRWRTIKRTTLSGRSQHSAVWTGDEMVIWGGSRGSTGGLDDGAAYRPSTGTWRRLPQAPIQARSGHIGVWTGREMLVWGGSGSGIGVAAGPEADFPDGAAWSPDANEWRRIRTFPLVPRSEMAAAWTSRQLVVWGGREVGRPNDGGLADGAVYSPTGDEWTVMSPGPLDGRVAPSIAPIGDRVLVAGGTRVGEGTRLDGAIYDPGADSWTPIRPAPHELDCRQPCPAGIWTGGEVIFPASGLAYDPGTDTWRSLPECRSAGPGVTAWAAVWTGSQLLVWGGAEAQGEPVLPAAYDPGSDRWAVLEDDPHEATPAYGSAVWTGEEMIVWGGGTGDGERHKDLAVGATYRPGAALPDTPCPPPASGPTD